MKRAAEAGDAETDGGWSLVVRLAIEVVVLVIGASG